MIDVEKMKLIDILPSSLDDEIIKLIIKAVDALVEDVSNDVKKLELYSRLDELPTEILNLLAWQFHVDFFRYDMTDEVKRNLIRQSIAWHRRKGTPQAVEDMVSAIYSTAEYQDWYDYGGSPYHFKVNIYGEAVTEPDKLNELRDSVYAVKNARSIFDGFNFIEIKETTWHVAFAAGIDHTSVVVDPTPVASTRIGIGMIINNEEVVNG